MEIRIQRRLKGSDSRALILAQYGDRGNLERYAAAGDAEAKDALFNLRLLEEDPSRRRRTTLLVDVIALEEADLSKLTGTRLHILEVLRGMGQVNLQQLTRRLKRDAKNVSEDVACLMEYGLITGRRQGREKLLAVAGNQIVITV
jgi:predicted transcriptional regulator